MPRRVQLRIIIGMSSEDTDTPPYAADQCLCREGLTVEVRVGVFDRPIVRARYRAPLPCDQ